MLEQARNDKTIGASLEAKVLLYVADETLRQDLVTLNPPTGLVPTPATPPVETDPEELEEAVVVEAEVLSPEDETRALPRFQDLKKNLENLIRWASENRQLFSLLALLLGALVLVNVAIALLTAVRTFPLLPEALQVVGLGYSAWFVVRKLLWADRRSEVLHQWASLKNTILGSGIADTIFNYYPTPAAEASRSPVKESTVEESTIDGPPTDSPVPSEVIPTVDSNGVDELRYLFLSSQVEFVDAATALEALPHKVVTEDLAVGMVKAVGCKCDRCWNYSTYVGQFSNYPDLCERCVPIVDR